MPILSMFFGIIIRMYFGDTQQHHQPHIHAEYQGQMAVFDIETGAILGGALPPAKVRLVLAWMEIHREELLADWQLAVNHEPPFKIDPLR
jgi:hypothetical protein